MKVPSAFLHLLLHVTSLEEMAREILGPERDLKDLEKFRKELCDQLRFHPETIVCRETDSAPSELG